MLFFYFNVDTISIKFIIIINNILKTALIHFECKVAIENEC